MLGGHTGGMGGAAHHVGGLGGIGPAWTRGEMERPAGEKDMGTWKASIYTEEQQKRLGVTAEGNPVVEENHAWNAEAKGAKEDDDASSSSWASLVGQKAEVALERIKTDRPDV